MRNWSLAALALSLTLPTAAAWPVIYDPSSAPDPAAANAPAATTGSQAQAALDAGLAALKDAEGPEGGAAPPSEPQPLSAAQRDAYARARAQFEAATKQDPSLAEAWNGLGYSQRKLGDYQPALVSYGRALALRPGYPQATEYRGEAYLGLNRIEDAKQAYLDLFATNRVLADRLLGAMKYWIARQSKADAHAADAADLAKWVEERSQIAAQTAALTRQGAAASWR